MREAKLQWAYFLAEQRDDAIDQAYEGDDYSAAAKHVGNLLFTQNIKAHRSEFDNVRLYIEARYLTEGKLDVQKAAARELVEQKAWRIYTTTRSVPEENWFDAEKYVKIFYETIILAAMMDDPQSVWKLLNAFAFSDAPQNNYQVINCFEAALAVYFLNPETLNKLREMNGFLPWP